MPSARSEEVIKEAGFSSTGAGWRLGRSSGAGLSRGPGGTDGEEGGDTRPAGPEGHLKDAERGQWRKLYTRQRAASRIQIRVEVLKALSWSEILDLADA